MIRHVYRGSDQGHEGVRGRTTYKGRPLPDGGVMDRTDQARAVWWRRKRFVIMRCWAGNAAVMVPQPTKYRYWRRKNAERFAGRLTANSHYGGWYVVERSA